MADVTPVERHISPSIRTAFWEAVSSDDAGTAYAPPYVMPAVSAVQVTGTFGGATVTLAGSNDGTNFVTLKDMAGNDISVTSASLVDFSTGALYVKPIVTGGTSEDIDVLLVVRG